MIIHLIGESQKQKRGADSGAAMVGFPAGWRNCRLVELDAGPRIIYH
jgi:hypothetical protein